MTGGEKKISVAETKIDLSQIGGGSVSESERKPAVGIRAIEGKVINIKGFTHTRGSPTQNTNQSLIGEDGKTDYYLIDTKESFEVEHQKETKEVSRFFVTESIAKQINRVENVQEAFEQGTVIGDCKPLKRTSKKTGNQYWCLVFPSEEDYN